MRSLGPVIYSLALAVVGMAFVSPLPSERPARRVPTGEPFMMPSDTGSTKELTEKDLEDLGMEVRGETESLTITVKEVPKGE